MSVCVYICVCVRERAREREREKNERGGSLIGKRFYYISKIADYSPAVRHMTRALTGYRQTSYWSI